MMTIIAGLKTERNTVHVILQLESKKQNGEIEWKTTPTQPEKVMETLKDYNEDMLSFKLLLWQIAEVPLQGSCDTRPHEIVMRFQGENDKLLELKVSTVKSTGDNCLINALSQANGALGKGFRAQKVRDELAIPQGPISADECGKICEKLGVTHALYRVQDGQLILISESATVSDKHAQLLLQDGHYYKIVSDVRQLLKQKPEASLQIQDSEDVCPKMTEKVVTLADGIEE